MYDEDFPLSEAIQAIVKVRRLEEEEVDGERRREEEEERMEVSF